MFLVLFLLQFLACFGYRNAYDLTNSECNYDLRGRAASNLVLLGLTDHCTVFAVDATKDSPAIDSSLATKIQAIDTNPGSKVLGSDPNEVPLYFSIKAQELSRNFRVNARTRGCLCMSVIVGQSLSC
jgi:hypothetical protein